MFVKLINPRSKQVMTFVCANEAYYERQGAMDRDAQDIWVQHQESQNYDTRRLVLWPGTDLGVQVELVEIHIPLFRDKSIAILTNWEAWLCNEAGRSIDRIFRTPAALAA